MVFLQRLIFILFVAGLLFVALQELDVEFPSIPVSSYKSLNFIGGTKTSSSSEGGITPTTTDTSSSNSRYPLGKKEEGTAPDDPSEWHWWTTCGNDAKFPPSTSSASGSSDTYFQRHARKLRQEADCLLASMQEDQVLHDELFGKIYNETKAQSQAPNAVFPYPLHLFTYGDDGYQETLRRLTRQANRSGYFQFGSITAFGPKTITQEFTRDPRHVDILHQPRGGGYWLWRFPMIEAILHTIPPWDYFLVMDAGSSLDPTNPNANRAMVEWLQELTLKSSFKYNPNQRQEIIKKQLHGSKNEERWTTSKIMQAFALDPATWPGAKTQQFEGGFTLARNGPQYRQLLALIYDALDPDPWIISDKYSGKSRQHYKKFKANRHDQSIHSVACKILPPLGCIGKSKKIQISKRKTRAVQMPFIKSRNRNPDRPSVDRAEAAELARGQAAAQQQLSPLFGLYGEMAAAAASQQPAN